MALSPADRKRLLKDPEGWVREHQIRVGKRALSELIQRRRVLVTAGEADAVESRELSRQIGAAKKQGESIEALLASKREVSGREKLASKELKKLDAELVELLASDVPADSERPVPVAAEVTAVDLHVVRVSAVTAEEESAWDDYVRRQANASVYHLHALRRVIEDSFGHETHYLVAREGVAIVGVLPLVRLQSRLFGNFMVSQPFFNYGGALVSHPGVVPLLMAEAQRLAGERGCSHIEYRDCEPLADVPVRTDKVAMWLELPANEEQLWKQIGSKVRAQIKRGGRFGLEAQVGGVELLDGFYQVFAENMRDLGTPVYGKAFFRKLLQSELGDRRLVVVRHEGKPVSAAFLLGFKDRMEVPWASTLRSANSLDANMFMYWELLRQACSGGYRIFDFGRSTRDAPTYRFKKQWGAQPAQLYWHYWLRDGGEPPKLNPDNPKYKLVIAAWQRLPVWVTRLAGPFIVKYLP